MWPAMGTAIAMGIGIRMKAPVSTGMCLQNDNDGGMR